jgi:hypothetical protein
LAILPGRVALVLAGIRSFLSSQCCTIMYLYHPWESYRCAKCPSRWDSPNDPAESRTTIKLLVTRDLAEIRPGQGAFVVEKINPFVTTLAEDPETGRGGGTVFDIRRMAFDEQGTPIRLTVSVYPGRPQPVRHQRRGSTGHPLMPARARPAGNTSGLCRFATRYSYIFSQGTLP